MEVSETVAGTQERVRGRRYRADIDGLRAVAILAVLGFHAFPGRVTGGFVGVDIFFVISGFLITGILIDGLEEGTLTLREFYSRRVRRIFPALVLVTLVCTVAGWFMLLPDEFAQVGKHVAAGLAFVSNLILWREAGYFDSSSDTKPLLHLWSLGVEEQFYLAWPILLILARRAGLRHLALPILLVGVLSFGVNLSLMEPDPSSAFYLPFARFWELMTGGFLAAVGGRWRTPAPRDAAGPEQHGGPRGAIHRGALEALSIAAVGLLVGSVFAFDRQTPFPGWWALVPTVGTFLLILSGGSWLNRRVLAHPALVHVGLISFPLYLWHWPMLTIARIMLGQTPPAGQRLALVAAAFIAADLTYRFVERPFRSHRRGVPFLVVSAVVVALCGAQIWQTSGMGWRFEDRDAVRDLGYLPQWGQRAAMQVPCLPPNEDWRQPSCRLSAPGTPGIAIFGDSHAQHLFAGLADLAPEQTWMLLSTPGCPPIRAIELAMTTGPCRGRSEAALAEVIRRPEVTTVILAFQSSYMADTVLVADYVAQGQAPAVMSVPGAATTSKSDVFLFGLESVVQALEAADKKVLVVLDTPELPFSPRDCLRQTMLGLGANASGCVLRTEEVLARQQPYREVIRRLVAEHPQIAVFDPIPLLCPDAACRIQDENGMLFRDSHHLSARGSTLVARSLLEWMASQPSASKAPD